MQLPASFFAYRKQQHRWTCGPVQLWRKAAVDIWASSLPLYHKLDLILCYFGIRKVATHWVSMGFFCGLVPLSVFTPEVPIKDPCAHRFPPLPHQHLCWVLSTQALLMMPVCMYVSGAVKALAAQQALPHSLHPCWACACKALKHGNHLGYKTMVLPV